MADDFSIPAAAGRAPISSGYRTRRTGWQPDMRLLAIAAAGLGVTLLAGVGGWALLGRRPAVVPVIEADSRPLRVKPENPGGMQFSNADDAMPGDGGAGTERMAPAPEAPAPRALRAQMQQTLQPPPAAAPPVSAALPAAPVVQPPSVAAPASPLPDTAPRSVGAPPARVPAAGTLVQLAAVETEAAAQAEWQRLARRMPDLLGDRRPVVQKAERDGKTIWRIRTGGFADTAEATGFCGKVKAKGGSCTLALF